MAQGKYRIGPNSARVVSELRSAIGAGHFRAGDFLPCTRDLGRKHKVSAETARRALKSLEVEGLIAAEPRHGFQVICRPGDATKPVLAYVLAEWVPEQVHSFWGLMLGVFQKVAARNGYTLLSVGDASGDPQSLVEQFRKAEASGIVVDTHNPALLEAAGKLNLPMVVAENWYPEHSVDAVIQDNFSGALQAADYLASRGHTRIAWAGATRGSIQAVERWGGAVAGLGQHGLAIPPELTAPGVNMRNVAAARALLDRRDRPTAVIALWADVATAVARAAGELGLELGRDLELVGWATAEEFESYRDHFPENRTPATVVWRIETLAETALARLAERRARPELPVARINVEARLRPGDGVADGGNGK